MVGIIFGNMNIIYLSLHLVQGTTCVVLAGPVASFILISWCSGGKQVHIILWLQHSEALQFNYLKFLNVLYIHWEWETAYSWFYSSFLSIIVLFFGLSNSFRILRAPFMGKGWGSWVVSSRKDGWHISRGCIEHACRSYKAHSNQHMQFLIFMFQYGS